jgi:hypothetical protein
MKKSNSMKEVWKDVEGYEGLYQVSNLGRVKSLPKMIGRGVQYHVGERIITPHKAPNGYLRLHLDKNGKRAFFSVHRLVAKAFVANPHNYPHVNHKNEVKNDNVASNLEWCTPKYNSNYGTRKSRISQSKMGHIVSEVTKAKLREANLGSNSPSFGKKRTDETRMKISKALKRFYSEK